MKMAYQPYGYGGYGPASYYPGPVPDQLAQLRQNPMPQNLPHPLPPQMQQVVQAGQNSPIWVQGEEGAKAYMVAAGCSVMLMDSESNVFYLKSSDQSGMPMPLRVFDYTERTANTQTKPQPTPDFDPSQFITRDELESILAERLKKPARPAKAKEETEHE